MGGVVWLFPALEQPRRVVIHGCEVLIRGRVFITVPDGTSPDREAEMLAAEPRAVCLGDGRYGRWCLPNDPPT